MLNQEMTSFSFDQVGKALTATGAAPPKSFLPPDAKERFTDGSDSIAGHLPGDSTLLEVFASRYFFVLNCCDYQYESIVTMTLRPLGWGCRIGLFLTSVIFCVMAAMRDVNIIQEYTLSRERDTEGTLRNDESDMFESYVHAVFAVWCVSIVLEMFTYLVGRGSSQKPHEGQCSAFPAFLLNRVSIGGEENEGRCFLAMLMMVWFLGFAASAIVMVYSVMAHCFVTRNPWMLGFFGLMMGFEFFAALADAVSIGGIDGLAVMNRPASWLASLRIVIVLPVQIIFSAFFLWICRPPWESVA
jgi:hypothetical protein